MTVRVVYHDNSYDMISAFILQLGIECAKIKMFYRESEKKWVTIGEDPIRKSPDESSYGGTERRLTGELSEQQSLRQLQRSHKG